ncbi:MAG: DUF1579 domain-containing protein [Candidatus Omnitrophica bacterium]|nr:DUF1579 domain-containing protein [Candidatus Omnitrophota bacterium]
MNQKTTWFFLVLTFLVFPSFKTGAFADTEKTVTKTTTTVTTTYDQLPDWKEKTVPGTNHAVLNTLVGNWNYKVRWSMTPTGPVNESSGTSTNRWIMGGRYLEQTYTGTMMGEPFQGLGVTGYDNMKKEYQSMWIDNMSTGMMISEGGQYDDAAKTISESGAFSCPMTGEVNKIFRAEWKIADADHYSYEMYTNAPDGSEFKSMEINYTRQ